MDFSINNINNENKMLMIKINQLNLEKLNLEKKIK